MTLVDQWPAFAALAALLISIAASVHALMNKEDVRATIGWVGLAWLVPVLGGLLYLVLGINRIRRRARDLRGGAARAPSSPAASVEAEEVAARVGTRQVVGLIHLVDRVVHHRLLGGNAVDLLVDGDEAYPAMIEAIGRAERTVAMCSYIFDHDVAGRRFVEALAGARERGVEVRVLVDGVGVRYGRPPVHHALDRLGVPNALFLPTRVPWRAPYFNLRNHRKLLVVDGVAAFTGGMNIRAGHLRGEAPDHPIRDLHVRVRGPVVGQLFESFAEDWRFTTGESLTGPPWIAPRIDPTGDVFARAVPDGPDEDLDELRLTLLGALSVACERVCVVTPYFLPDDSLVTALNVAALRGVQVDIVLPERGNLALVRWASTAALRPLLQRGCRLWASPGDFDHTKLMVVDGAWTLVGSGNWDPRSLRLNFELNLECYGRDLASRALAVVESRLAGARPITVEALERRPFLVKLRDNAARLLSPYL